MIFKGLVEKMLACVVVPDEVIGFIEARQKFNAEQRQPHAVQ